MNTCRSATVAEEYAEDYGIDSVTISWNRYTQTYNNIVSENSKTTTWSNTSKNTDTAGTAAYIDNDTKTFQIPSAYYSDDEIIVRFTLKDVSKFKGEVCVGSWTGFEFYNGSKWSNTGTITMTISGDGSITSSYTYINGRSVDHIDEDGTSAVLNYGSSSEDRTYYNDGSVGIIHYNSGNSSTSDVCVFAKGDTEPTYDLWKESNSVWCMRLFVGEEYVGAVFANDTLTPKLYAGVTITWNDGGDSFTTSSNFTITSAGGATLASVTSEPAG